MLKKCTRQWFRSLCIVYPCQSEKIRTVNTCPIFFCSTAVSQHSKLAAVATRQRSQIKSVGKDRGLVHEAKGEWLQCWGAGCPSKIPAMVLASTGATYTAQASLQGATGATEKLEDIFSIMWTQYRHTGTIHINRAQGCVVLRFDTGQIYICLYGYFSQILRNSNNSRSMIVLKHF